MDCLAGMIPDLNVVSQMSRNLFEASFRPFFSIHARTCSFQCVVILFTNTHETAVLEKRDERGQLQTGAEGYFCSKFIVSNRELLPRAHLSPPTGTGRVAAARCRLLGGSRLHIISVCAAKQSDRRTTRHERRTN